MSKRDKPVKKRKRTDWRGLFRQQVAQEIKSREAISLAQDDSFYAVKRKEEALAELTRYRLICDWACQRIEKLEKSALGWDVCLLNCCNKWMQTALERSKEITKLQKERRILLDTLFEVQAENLMQGEDILRQRDELIKLRGEPAERISL